MIVIRPITALQVEAFRRVRLAALLDTPWAFGSTYERESQFSDEEWEGRAVHWTSGRSAAYLSWDGEEACGIIAGFFDEHAADIANMVSMWVAPTHRRRGVGRMLVRELIKWAHSRGATTVRLMVTSKNDGATVFYERLGFSKTGRTEPYPNDPALVEFEMIRSLPPSPSGRGSGWGPKG